MNFEEWLSSTHKSREELLSHCKSESPNDSGPRTLDIDKSIRYSDMAGNLLADAEYYLSQHSAQSMLKSKTDDPNLPSKDRTYVVRDAVKDIQRIVDGLKVACRTLSSRIKSACNARRSY